MNQVDSLPLDIRFWDCSNCGTKHIDRDVNAAKNIRDEGLRIITGRINPGGFLQGQPLSCGTRDKAMKCGLGGFPHEQLHQEAYRQTVRHSNRGRKKSTTALVSG